MPELPELDNLFSPEGPIFEAQKQASRLFGADETWFLVGGNTCGIQGDIVELILCLTIPQKLSQREADYQTS